jgi:hypothetical protein
MLDYRHTRQKPAHARPLFSLRYGRLSQKIAVLLGIIAILIQGFGVQTHIHTWQASPYFHVVDIFAGSLPATLDRTAIAEITNTPHDEYPIDDGTANCPLCQEFAHFGQFIHGSAPFVGLPLLITVSVVVFAEIGVSLFAASHIWRGRAPPRE